MREIAGSAAAPAARCRKCLRWGSFILNLPLASHHSITSSAVASSTASTSRPSALAVSQEQRPANTLSRYHHEIPCVSAYLIMAASVSGPTRTILAAIVRSSAAGNRGTRAGGADLYEAGAPGWERGSLGSYRGALDLRWD